MEKYRSSLLGRALADVLLQSDLGYREADQLGEELFSSFDEIIQEELLCSSGKKSIGNEEEANYGSSNFIPFTNQKITMKGNISGFNHLEETWSIHAEIQSADLVVDYSPLDLPLPNSTDTMPILMKFQKKVLRRKKKQS